MYNSHETMFGSIRVQLTIFRLLCPLVFFVCFYAPTWADPIVRTVYTDSKSLIVEFKLPKLRFSEETSGGQSYSQVSFNGAQYTLEVGHPKLPTFSQLIGIPVREVPQATIINSRFEIRPTKKVLPVQSDLVRGSEDSRVSHSMLNEINSDFYRQNRFYPTHLAEVIPVGLIRDQRVAQLKIQPIQYNPRLSQLKIYQELQIRIDFNQPATSGSHTIATYKPSRPFEELFQTRLLNYNQAKTWRSVRQSQAQMTSAFAGGNMEQRYRFSITRTGMYRITYHRLQRAGVDTSLIDLETIKLENNGRMVGVYVIDKAEYGKFDREDAIVFYGQGLVENNFTDTNVYWLSWNGLESSRVGARDAQLKTRGTRIPLAFLKTERFERDIFHNTLESGDARSEDLDHYFWASFKEGDSKMFPINIPGAVPRQSINRLATIRVRLQGASLFTHKARLLLNNKWIARTQDWKRQDDLLTIHEFQQRQFLVHDTVNQLTVIAEDNPRISSDEVEFYVDWFEVDYWHSFEALSGALEFNTITEPESNGIAHYRVENFRTDEIDVYKIQDGSIVAKLENGRISGRSSSNFRITFEDVVTQESRYFVLDNRAYHSVMRIVPAKPAALRDPCQSSRLHCNQPQRLSLIAYSLWAEFRRSQGHTVTIVDIDDVYDQFNYGVFQPVCNPHFLTLRIRRVGNNRLPSYVLLVGDAHYDYKKATVVHSGDWIQHNL